MKNPSIAAAGVLVGLALLVGGVALSAGGAEDDAVSGPMLPVSDAPQEVSFANLTPHEVRKKGRMEEAQRELERVKKIGKEVMPNVYKIKDETGDPTYYYGKLIKGVGRNGEPLYMSAQFKRLPAMPLKEVPKLPAKLQPKLKKDPVNALKLKKDKAGGGGGQGDGSGGTGDNGNKGPTLGGTTGGG